jgi:hypothetical protein
LVNELVAFGEISPGKPALCALLEVISEDVGEDVKLHINELLKIITQETQTLNPTLKTTRSLTSEFFATLSNAEFHGEEGEPNGTGSFYRYDIHLKNVIFKEYQNEDSNQQYEFSGDWLSSVYKEVYVFQKRVDTPWGHNKKPYGSFKVKVKIINGVLEQIEVKADRYNDSPNNYAANKVEQLIKLKIQEIKVNNSLIL